MLINVIINVGLTLHIGIGIVLLGCTSLSSTYHLTSRRGVTFHLLGFQPAFNKLNQPGRGQKGNLIDVFHTKRGCNLSDVTGNVIYVTRDCHSRYLLITD